MRILRSVVLFAILCFYGVRSENDRLYATGRNFVAADGSTYQGLTEVVYNGDSGLTISSLLSIPQSAKANFRGRNIKGALNSDLFNFAKDPNSTVYQGYLIEGNCAAVHADVSKGYNTTEFSFDVVLNSELTAFMGRSESLEFANFSQRLNTLVIDTDKGSYCSDLSFRFEDDLTLRTEVIYDNLKLALYGSESGYNLTALAFFRDASATGLKGVTAYLLPGIDCAAISNESLVDQGENSTYSATFAFASTGDNGQFFADADFNSDLVDFTNDVALAIAGESKNVLTCVLIASETGELPTDEPVRTTEAPTNGPRGDVPTESISAAGSIVPAVVLSIALALLAF